MSEPALRVVGADHEPDLITLDEGSAKSGIAKRTLCRAVKTGAVPSECVLQLSPRYIRLRREPFMRWIREGHE